MKDPDTDIGGPQQRFPPTNHSAIVGARSQDQETRQRAFNTILINYWKPVYKYIRLKWNAANEDAKDLTQGFFLDAYEKNHFANYDAAKASFQTFLRTCLDGFISNKRKADSRLKRGGGVDHFSLDFVTAEDEFGLRDQSSKLTPEDFFYREWVRSLFMRSVDRLRTDYLERNKTVHFQLFESYDLNDEKISYADLGVQFGLEQTTVNNYLAATRRDFRKMVLDELRQITATEEEFKREALALLGVERK
jgi:DNA-directed RNA polymerase specialized sigma24 family protein